MSLYPLNGRNSFTDRLGSFHRCRTADILAGQLQVHKMSLAADGKLLFIFTNRAAHLVETREMNAAEPLGEFGAIKVFIIALSVSLFPGLPFC